MLKECGNPSILATMCWKSVDESGDVDVLNGCGGINHVDCGLFCASSNLQCAKNALGMIAGITGLVSFIMGDASSLSEFKDMNRLGDAVQFVKDMSFDGLVSVLKDSSKLFENTKSGYEILDGFKGIGDLVAGTIALSKWIY